jgi:hypothetical protein
MTAVELFSETQNPNSITGLSHQENTMNHYNTGQDRFVDSVMPLTSTPLTHRTGLNVRWWCLAVLFVLTPVPDGMAGDPVSDDNSAQPAVTAPTTRPCVTNRQVDAALADAMAGPAGMPGPNSLPTPKSLRGPTDVGKNIGKTLGNQGKAALQEGISEGADVFAGIRAKSQKENAEIRTHIESLYQEYRRLAAEGKVTGELRDVYAKEKIGPRLDTIKMNEINWQGVSADRGRVAGHVHAYVELVEIERQEIEGLKHHVDTEKTCLQNWAIQVKHKAISKDKAYQVPPWEEARASCLAHFKKMFYHSPQYLKAQEFKRRIAVLQAQGERIEQASKDCEGEDAAPVALRRRSVDSGTDRFQKAIEQAEQEERDRPAREARERAAQARAAEAERLTRIKEAERARAYEREQAEKRAQDRREASELLNTMLGVGAQILQDNADQAQAEYENQQRLAQERQEQQRRIQEEQNAAYRAEAARAEAFNRQAARASEERARQQLSAASNTPSHGPPLPSSATSSVPPQPSYSGPRPLHIPQDPPRTPGIGLDFGIPDQEKRRERERAERETAERKDKKRREIEAARAEANRKRDAEARQLQQDLTNARLEQEAVAAREVARRRAEIQAEVDRRDAVTVIPYEQGSCPPSALIINNTKVHLWVTFEYIMEIEGRGSVPSRISAPVAPYQRIRQWHISAPSCDSGKRWNILAGGSWTWTHTGHPDVP